MICTARRLRIPQNCLSVVAFEKLPQIAARMKSMLDENRRLLRDFLLGRDDLDYFWPEYGAIVFPRLKFPRPQTEMSSPFATCCATTLRLPWFPAASLRVQTDFRIGVGTPTESVRESLQQLGLGLDRYRAGLRVGA